MVRKFFMATAITVLAVGSTACATKKFVRTSVGEVNTKVDSLGRSVEETQERTRRNEGRIAEVDTKAQAAADSAATANSGCGQGDDRRGRSGRQGRRRLTGPAASSSSKSCSTRIRATSSSARPSLPDEAKTKIDQMVQQLKQDPKNVFIEIEGHTDNVGDKIINSKIGLERAEAVQRYLYEQYQIPLHKMNVISYGEDKPVAPNNTRDGRAQNRRVVIKVLA